VRWGTSSSGKGSLRSASHARRGFGREAEFGEGCQRTSRVTPIQQSMKFAWNAKRFQ
jgi:hypothetical protein